jgi:hypothetical protein
MRVKMMLKILIAIAILIIRIKDIQKNPKELMQLIHFLFRASEQDRKTAASAVVKDKLARLLLITLLAVKNNLSKATLVAGIESIFKANKKSVSGSASFVVQRLNHFVVILKSFDF